MARLDTDEIFKDVRRMIQLTASWPGPNLSWKCKIIRFIWMSFLGFFLVTMLIQALNDFGNFAKAAYAVTCVAGTCNGIVKYVILFSKGPQFFEMLSLLKDPLLASHEDDLDVYLRKRIKNCNILRNVFLGSISIAVVFMSASPIPHVKSRALPLAFPLDMREQPTVVYALVWCFHTLVIGMVVENLAIFDVLIFTFMQVAIAQLEMLRERIVHSTDSILPTYERLLIEEEYDIIINKLLRKCVMQHVVIERYIISIEEFFTWAFLVQLILSVSLVCLLGFTCLLTPKLTLEFGQSSALLLGALLQLAIFCVPGDEIIHQSRKIGDACYMSLWNNCGPSVRKSLLLIMERSNRPFSITAAKFATLSLETLLAVINSAISYFTVLWQLYSPA